MSARDRASPWFGTVGERMADLPDLRVDQQRFDKWRAVDESALVDATLRRLDAMREHRRWWAEIFPEVLGGA